jgi:ubiquinone biosynthesis monooxygenase Coq7
MPGRHSAHDWLGRALRVDQAGEYGATRIYEGQRAVFEAQSGTAATAAAIRRMAAQEQRHLARFDALLNARRVRPTLLGPLWHVAGFALGAGTALLGERAAMACTAAVEDAITEHYAAQQDRLGGDEPEVAAAIAESASEEEEHRLEAIARGAETAPFYRLLAGAIKTGCKVAIRLSERL